MIILKKQHDTIIVLDFGSQYNQLIARRIREFGVYSELHPHTITAEEIKAMNPKGIIFSGGPNSVYGEGALHCDEKIFELGLPIFGICYGMQLMTQHFGGKVERANHREYGKAVLKVENESKLYANLPEEQVVWMSHGDLVTDLPEGFVVDATSESCPIAGMSNEEKNLYGVQFHPEVRHSEHGNDLIKNFVFGVCGCSEGWNMENFIEVELEKIRETVGDKKSTMRT